MNRFRALSFLCILVCTAPHVVAQTTIKTLGTYAYDASGNIISTGPDGDGLINYYTYDSAGRLIRLERKQSLAATPVLTETYEYDAYGNQTRQTTNGTVTTLSANEDTNRLTAASHDVSGNVTSYDGVAYDYDATGTLTRRSGSWGSTFYLYTADDERIGIEGPDLTWRYTVRDLDGKVLREWGASAWNGALGWVEDYVYRDGQLAAAERPAAQGGIRHFHLDHLGSPRLITSATATVYADHDYYPFGREITDPTQEMTGPGFDTPEPMKFTGHEREFAGSYADPPLDYMHARYYVAHAGRFLSVDPTWKSAHLKLPQSWNRYSYVMNNPLKYTDPTGRVFKCETIMKEDGSTEQICSEEVDVEAEDPGVEPVPEPSEPSWIASGWGLITNEASDLKQSTKLAWSDFKNEFKDGGCVAVFLDATADALNPFTPSITTLAEPAASTAAVFKYNAAIRYAASRPNFLGGTGLIYPMKSSVVRAMLADANAAAAAGAMLNVDLAIAYGLYEEIKAIRNGSCQ